MIGSVQGPALGHFGMKKLKNHTHTDKLLWLETPLLPTAIWPFIDLYSSRLQNWNSLFVVLSVEYFLVKALARSWPSLSFNSKILFREGI